MYRHLARALCALSLLVSSAAAAYQPFAYLFDDFDRADSTNLNLLNPAAPWSEEVTDFYTSASRARCSDYALAKYTPQTPLLADDWISIDAIHNNQFQPQYVGLVLGYADPANNITIKLQDNGGTGQFNRIYFRYGAEAGSQGWAGMTGGSSYVNLPVPVSSVRMRARLNSNNLVVVQLDINADGVWETQYARGAIPTANLGTGFGITAFGNPIMDNFGGYLTPEPVSALLLAAGALVLSRRNRKIA